MKRVGDMPLVKRVLKETAPLTPAQSKLVEAAATIRLDPEKVERAYMARQLVQCTLPHSNPGNNIPAWTRRSGNLMLTIQPGWDAKKNTSFGFPYGTLPRLVLFWITTEAVLTKSRRLELGRSLSEFMRELGLIPASAGGGKRSDATRLKSQMERLFRCRISFDQVETRDDGAQGERWLDMQVAPTGEFWWNPKHPEQGALWGSWLELGEKFFEAITAAPVPADMRALRALRRSPLALDLYAWVTYRAFAVTRRGQAQFVPWDGLMQQIGTDYSDVKDFRRKAGMALRKVRTVYPGLHLTNERGGIKVHPSRLAVPSRS